MSSVKNNIFGYFIVFVLLFVSKDTVLFGTNANQVFSYILYATLPIVLLLVFGALLLHNEELRVQKKSVATLVFLVVLSLFTMLLSEKTLNLKFFYEWLMFLLAFSIYLYLPFSKFKRIFVDIMLFFSVFSLICFALHYTFPAVERFFPSISNTVGQKFYNLFFTVVPYEMPYVSFRNYGFSREPSVFQVLLNLSLIFAFSEPIKIWKLLVIVLTIASTFSTSGYIICFLLIIFAMLKKKHVANKKIFISTLIASLLLFILFENDIIEYDGNIFTKLFFDNSSRNSRFGAIPTDLYIASDNIVFGRGFQYVESNFVRIAQDVFGFSNAHNTNTIFKMLAVHGLPFTTLVCSGMMRFFKKISKNLVETITFIIAFFMALSSADLIFNTVIYVLVFYGVNDAKKVDNY